MKYLYFFIFCSTLLFSFNCSEEEQKIYNSQNFEFELENIQRVGRECSNRIFKVAAFLAKADNSYRLAKISSSKKYYIQALSYANEISAYNSSMSKNIDRLKAFIVSQKKELSSVMSAHKVAQKIYVSRDANLVDKFTLKGIPFIFAHDSAKIQKGYNLAQAYQIAKALEKYKGRTIYITGFTNTLGKAAYNKELSIRRAESLKIFLIQKYGLKNTIHIEGYGEEYPVCRQGEREELQNEEYRCSIKEDLSKSRRVTIAVLGSE